MSNTTAEILVGGVVLAAALGFGIYAAQVAGLQANTDGYTLSASFRSIEGVNVGTDVRLAGVKIGTVQNIDLNPETFRADTLFAINPNVEIPDDSAIAVASEGLLGGNFIEIVPGGSPFYFEAGDEIEDTQGSVSLVSLLLRFVSGGGE
ncbi:MAG: outer membrane lipid asymmetry maintenance protein MlaD [Pseudomonadota bacterium]